MRELKHQLLSKLNELYCHTAQQLIGQAKQLQAQTNNPKIKEKLHSLHEPYVDYVSKGRAHKHCEFAIKVGIVSTQKEFGLRGILSSHVMEMPWMTCSSSLKISNWKKFLRHFSMV